MQALLLARSVVLVNELRASGRSFASVSQFPSWCGVIPLARTTQNRRRLRFWFDEHPHPPLSTGPRPSVMANVVSAEVRQLAISCIAARPRPVPQLVHRLGRPRVFPSQSHILRAAISTNTRDLAATAAAEEPGETSSKSDTSPRLSYPAVQPARRPQPQHDDPRSLYLRENRTGDLFSTQKPTSTSADGSNASGGRQYRGGALEMFNNSAAQAMREKFGEPLLNALSTRRGLDIGRMNTGSTQRGELVSMKTPVAADTAAPIFKLNASTGRSIKIDDNRQMDLGRAFNQLEIKCSVNKVRADFNSQRFHERPGVKRKRLRQVRWRRRFKVGFQAVVARVEELRRKGW